MARIQQQEKALADSARKKLGLEMREESASQLSDAMEKKSKAKKKLKNNTASKKGQKMFIREARKLQKNGEKESKKKKILKEINRDPEDMSKKLKRRVLENSGEEPCESEKSSTLANKKKHASSKKAKDPSKARGKKRKSSENADFATADQQANAPERKRSKRTKRLNLSPEDPYPDRTPASGWWGANRFISSGFAGQIKEVVPLDRKERQTFDEDDQEKVYMFAHNAKRKGKVGLGH